MTKTTERHQALLHMLNARGYATIDELTKCFSVTPQTIRKDINTLAGQGKVQRFHGGVGMPLSTENILYEQRKKLFLPEKKAIAQMLAIARELGGIALAEALSNKARAHGMLGDNAQERECLTEALPLLEQAYGPEHPRPTAARERLSQLREQEAQAEQPLSP